MEFQKCNEIKVLRDPVNGYVHVELQVIWDCINSSWFQRLRRIRQLGGACMVYHCAEHSRFSHSLGVYEIVRRMTEEVPDIRGALSDYEKVLAMAAGLLHDLGHGPYSHAFEFVTETAHEVYTCRILEGDTDVHDILEQACPGLAKDVADVIRHDYRNPLIGQMISSQLDADRMDYLIRDAYFTGTKYGEFDRERILRTLRVREGQLVIKQSGVYAVENYIMARYHMYWQIYYHPVARSYERVLLALFRRLRDLQRPLEDSLSFLNPLIIGEDIPLPVYFRMDEHSFSYAFLCLCEHEDAIVSDLACRIRDRRLFKYIDADDESRDTVYENLIKAGYDPRYYWRTDGVMQIPYVPYQEEEGNAIWVSMKNGEIREVSDASSIVHSLIHGESHDDNKVFFPDCGGNEK